MKFLVVFCFVALAAADDDKFLDKKPQPLDAIQNASALTPSPLLNGQIFPPASFPTVFGAADPVSNLAYTGFNGNVSPIQTINPDFFAAPASGLVNGAVATFPVTRAVLPGTSSVVNGVQSSFPVGGNVFPGVSTVPTAVNAIPAQFQTGLYTAVPTGVFPSDANAAASNGGISSVPGVSYRFLTPESLTGLPAQGLQTAQQVGLAAIPAFTSGILPSLANGVLQGQNIPAGIQQILKNPTGTPTGITGSNISSGPLTNVFRHA